MKKILTVILVSCFFIGIGSSSFAASMSEDKVNYRFAGVHKVAETLHENSDKKEDVEKEIESVISELKELYQEQENMIESNKVSSEISSQIDNLVSILDNYRSHLSFMEIEEEKILEEIFSENRINRTEKVFRGQGIEFKINSKNVKHPFRK
ncbi:MAG: DNA recombination protein RmuC [Firmicutes bacterium]|nr:DNA recombination protein RmuC [Bacillota bacterium]